MSVRPNVLECMCKGQGDGFFPQIVRVKRESVVFPADYRSQG